MILTERGGYLYKQLIKIVPGNQVDPHVLIRAFLTVNLPEEKDSEELSDYLIEALRDDKNIEVRRSIESYNLQEFLSCVAPYEVTDLKSFLDIGDDFGMTDSDLVLNLLIVKEFEFKSIVTSQASLKGAYKTYLKKSKSLSIRYIDDKGGTFRRFLNCIFSYSLSSEETRIRQFGDKSCDLRIRKIVEILYDGFRLSRNEAAWLCSEIINNDLTRNQVESLLREQIKYGMLGQTSPIIRSGDGRNTTDPKIAELADYLFKVNLNSEGYQLACGLYLYQRRSIDRRTDESGDVNIEELSNEVERPNDVALELSSLHQMLFQNKRFGTNRFLIVFPSPFLVQKVIKDINLETFHVKFVMTDDGLANLTKAWVFDPKQTVKRKKLLKDHVTIEAYKNNSGEGEPYGIIESCGYTDILVEDVQDCREEEYRSGILNILRTIDENCRLIVFCRDSDMRKDMALFHDVRKENLKGVIIIPTGTVGIRQKTNIWLADFNEDRIEASTVNLDIYEFVQAKYDDQERARRLFVDYCSPYPIDYTKYMSGQNPLRFFLKKSKTEVAEEKRRRPAHFVEFCPEIAFKYYEFKKSTSSGTYYVVYFVDGEKEHGRTTCYSAKTREEFLTWLLNEYIYRPVRVNKGTREAGDNDPTSKTYDADEYGRRGQTYSYWIRDVIGSQYKDTNVSLRAFWCFNPDLKTSLKLSEDEYGLLRLLVHSELGIKYLSEIDSELVNDVISEAEEFGDIDVTYIIRLLSMVLALAVKKGHIRYNPLSDGEGEIFSDRGVRKALARRTFPEDKFREFFKKLDPPGGGTIKAEDLALMIRLLTGISTAEVLALRWSDFLSFEGYSVRFHALGIHKRMVPGSNQPQNHSKANCYRILPLGRHLGEIMESKYLHEGGEDARDRFIVASDESSPLSAKRISLAFLRNFKKLGIPDIQIRIPKGDSGFSEVILTKYYGDLLQENFKYWAMKTAGFSEDEICFMVGTNKVTTFGKYYMDFNSEQSLLYTHAKLNRLESFLLYGSNANRIDRNVRTSLPEKIVYDTYRPIRVDLQFDPENKSRNAEVEIVSTFGVTVTEMIPFPESGGGE